MSATLLRAFDAQAGQAGPTARREQILDAAEACFVRNGFHRTTIQDLAREAAMSPGNFYHYFDSKEAIILALAQRDRGRAAGFLAALEQTGDRRSAFRAVLEHVFGAMPREAAILRVDVWAEATRNPAISAMVSETMASARAWFCDEFAILSTSAGCEPDALFDAVDPLIKGIIVNRALIPNYDLAAAVGHLCAVIDAGLDGRLPQVTHS